VSEVLEVSEVHSAKRTAEERESGSGSSEEVSEDVRGVPLQRLILRYMAQQRARNFSKSIYGMISHDVTNCQALRKRL
jgi:hypothetical protein